MSYLTAHFSPERVSSSWSMLDARRRSEEHTFNAQSQGIAGEISQLRLALDKARSVNAQETEALRQAQDQEYYKMSSSQDFRTRQLQSRLSEVPMINNSEAYRQLARLRDENAKLISDISQLESEKIYTENRAEACMLNELRPLENEIHFSYSSMESELVHTASRHNHEISEAERKMRVLDDRISHLNAEIGHMTNEIRWAEQRNNSAIKALNDDIQFVKKDVEYFANNNLTLANENNDIKASTLANSEKAKQIEADLSRARDSFNAIRPQARRLEHLVYGRGVSPSKSPVKASPLKSTKKKSKKRPKM